MLILDEPTASLDQQATDMLFGRIREVVRNGTSVIYITHRLAEIREIAHRVTVLRDGRVRGGGLVGEISDQELLELIVGRALGSTFPPKTSGQATEVNFSVRSISGKNIRDVSFDGLRGEIVGVAGVEGNGQTELMRALAGLQPFEGEIALNGAPVKQHELLHKAAFMPSDRHTEGLAAGLTVRENAALAALPKFASHGILSRSKELTGVGNALKSLAVKTPGIDASVLSLSGGNQQKVVMARALLSEPRLIVADEPTQGVDVGARAEIYRILRDVTNSGTPVIVNSSDAAELEGLCDQVDRDVAGPGRRDAPRGRMSSSPASSRPPSARSREPMRARAASRRGGGWLRHFLQSDNTPVVPLAIIGILLALLVFSRNENYLSAFNLSNILLLATALGFIALGQTVAILSARHRPVGRARWPASWW